MAGSDGVASNWSYDPTYQQAADFYISLSTGLGWANLTLQQWSNFTLSQWDTLPLTSTSIQAGSTGMAYSLCGNRQTQTEEEDGSVTTFTYDAANQLLTAEDTSGVTTYTYDANGNRLTIEEPGGDLTTNTWDPENRLVLVEHPGGGTTEYAYNGDGLRVEKTIDGTDTTKYIYDGNNMLQETDGSGTVEAKFTYALGEYGKVLSQHRGSDSHVYHFDGTDSVRLLTDDVGSVTDEYEFDAFGNLLSSTGSTPNSQLYKGRHLAYHVDPDAGPELQYALHYRNYEPSLGIFSNRDPAEDDSNLYRYVKNNPLNKEDPSGLDSGWHVFEEKTIRMAIQSSDAELAALFNYHVWKFNPRADIPKLIWRTHGRYINVDAPAAWNNQQIILAIFADEALWDEIFRLAKDYPEGSNKSADKFAIVDETIEARKEACKVAALQMEFVLTTAMRASPTGELSYCMYMIVNGKGYEYGRDGLTEVVETPAAVASALKNKPELVVTAAAGVVLFGMDGKLLKSAPDAPSSVRRAPAPDNYRGRFNADRHAQGRPRLPDDYDAHHRIPQEYMDHPEFRDYDFHQPGNIQGVKGSRADVNTHQLITNEWAEFRRLNPNATRSQIEAFAAQIDARFAQHWFQ